MTSAWSRTSFGGHDARRARLPCRIGAWHPESGYACCSLARPFFLALALRWHIQCELVTEEDFICLLRFRCCLKPNLHTGTHVAWKGGKDNKMSYVMCLLTGLCGSCTRRCTRHISLQRHGTLVPVCVCRAVLHVFVVRWFTLAQTKTPFPLPLLPLGPRPLRICIWLMSILIFSSHGGTAYPIGRTNGC